MKRLTAESPKGNFETMLNCVYSKDGWACIRHDGEKGDVPLTQWAREQCLRGCEAFPSGEFPAETPEEIDELLCSCMMDSPGCPVALAYCFASQASHLRDRLKIYEDLLFAEDGAEQITPDILRAMRTSLKHDPLTLEELRKMDGEPAYLDLGNGGGWVLVRLREDGIYFSHKNTICAPATIAFSRGGKVYRHKPEQEDMEIEPSIEV